MTLLCNNYLNLCLAFYILQLFICSRMEVGCLVANNTTFRLCYRLKSYFFEVNHFGILRHPFFSMLEHIRHWT